MNVTLTSIGPAKAKSTHTLGQHPNPPTRCHHCNQRLESVFIGLERGGKHLARCVTCHASFNGTLGQGDVMYEINRPEAYSTVVWG
jgi:hypothetical protein